jgi:SulP family sulfate permease
MIAKGAWASAIAFSERLPAVIRGSVPAITAGTLAGVLTVLLETSYAALIFSGELAPFVSRGVSMILAGTVVAVLLSTLFASTPGVVALP